jgi:hypothetical protein
MIQFELSGAAPEISEIRIYDPQSVVLILHTLAKGCHHAMNLQHSDAEI